MSGWEDAYDRQMQVWQFWNDPIGAKFAKGYADSVGHADGSAEGTAMLKLLDLQKDAALYADPIAVDRDMSALARAASETFAPEPLTPTDILTPNGFIWLPEPWYLLDRHEKRVAYRAMLWNPITDSPLPDHTRSTLEAVDLDAASTRGVLLAFYSYIGDRDDYYTDDEVIRDEYLGHPLYLMHVFPWWFGEPYPKEEPGSWTAPARQAQALFRLMQQTIAVRGRERPPRAARRRAQRAEFPDKYVTVITLRRPHRPPEPGYEAKTVEWSHRWLVSGFWRNQWFPSLGLHRQVWIHPYIKGPADKPLEVRSLRAFELTR